MFGRMVKLRTPMENTVEIEQLKIRTEKLEREKELVVAEVCIVYGEATKIWKSLTQENILDEVDGYVKITYIDRKNLLFIPHYTIIGKKGGFKIDAIDNEFYDHNYTCWVKKDCLIWHNKYLYAKERKKIEGKANARYKKNT